MNEPIIFHGNNIDLLREMPENSVDSIVTDPPYELGFMGKKWDSTGIAYSVELWSECLRVLKHGGHLLAFSGSRTYHRMTVAIEDAGFEIRDQIMWVYGSGFPKSLDVSKAIDKQAGAERQVIGSRPLTGNGKTMKSGFHQPDGSGAGETIKQDVFEFTAPATDEAQQWSGWGTALKPAHEPIVMARKPLGEKTVAENVLRHGTGAINIDGCRVEASDSFGGGAKGTSGFADGYAHDGWVAGSSLGRFPANFIHDGLNEEWARFFYCAKASKAERNAGLEALPAQFAPTMKNGIGMKEHDPETATPKQNFHPTVKPIALMRYLVRMVTPPNGTVLDPFTGSGTTLVAAVLENFNSIGMEMTAEYMPIITGRLDWALNQNQQPDSLFDI
jgi:DNA modification methylase